jgi:hypothetical protein
MGLLTCNLGAAFKKHWFWFTLLLQIATFTFLMVAACGSEFTAHAAICFAAGTISLILSGTILVWKRNAVSQGGSSNWTRLAFFLIPALLLLMCAGYGLNNAVDAPEIMSDLAIGTTVFSGAYMFWDTMCYHYDKSTGFTGLCKFFCWLTCRAAGFVIGYGWLWGHGTTLVSLILGPMWAMSKEQGLSSIRGFFASSDDDALTSEKTEHRSFRIGRGNRIDKKTDNYYTAPVWSSTESVKDSAYKLHTSSEALMKDSPPPADSSAQSRFSFRRRLVDTNRLVLSELNGIAKSSQL